MLNFLFSLALNMGKTFFSFISLFGYTYEGGDSSPIYIYYNLVLCAIVLVCILKKLSREKLNKLQLFMVFMPFLFLFSLTNTFIYGYINNRYLDELVYALLWGTTGIYLGLYLGRKGSILKLVKWFDIQMMIMTLASILTILIPFITGSKILYVGGSSTQASSYLASLAFGFNLYFMIISNKGGTFKVFENKLFYFVRVVMLPIQILCTILSGGRGAFIVIIIFIVYAIFIATRFKESRFKVLMIIICIVMAINYLLPSLSSNDFFSTKINRIFSYISETGIDITQTSNRDIVYTLVTNEIWRSPIIGHGLMSSAYIFPFSYAHNFFLEVLFDGGIIYLVVWIIIFFAFFNKLNRRIPDDQRRFLYILVIYTMIGLLFSGTFYATINFWFCLCYVAAFDSKKTELKRRLLVL